MEEKEFLREKEKLKEVSKNLENEEKEIDFIFMSHKEPKLASSGKIRLTKGCVLKFDKALDVEIEAFDPVGMDTKSLWGVEQLYRIHLKTTAKECEYTFTIKG